MPVPTALPVSVLSEYAQAYPEEVDPHVLCERMKGLLLEGGYPELAETLYVLVEGDEVLGVAAHFSGDIGPGTPMYKAYRLAGGVRPCAECRREQVPCVH